MTATDLDATELNDTEATLFEISVQLFTKEFVNQKVNMPKSTFVIRCNDVATFKELLWQEAHLFIKKEIVFCDDQGMYQWANEDPTAESLARFIQIQDKSAKKIYSVEDLSSKKLQKWTKRCEDQGIKCFVQIYGNSLHTKGHFTDAHKQLIAPASTDRAGAATNIATFELAQKLKERHGSVLSGQNIAWLQFANYILSTEPLGQDKLAEELPPPEIMRYFNLAPENPVQKISQLRRSADIGKRVNKGMQAPIKDFMSDIDILVEYFEKGLSCAKALKIKCQAFDYQLNSNELLLDGFEQSVHPEVNELSRGLQAKITNIEDTDHQEPMDDQII